MSSSPLKKFSGAARPSLRKRHSIQGSKKALYWMSLPALSLYVFHGALVAQLIQGHSLQESMRRANAVAALSCRGLDGQSKIPTTTELDAYLEAHR